MSPRLIDGFALGEHVRLTAKRGESRTLDTHVNELRRHLEVDPAHPELVRTVWRVGYLFALP